MKKIKKGDKTTVFLTGAGCTTTEPDQVVLRVAGGKIWLDNGPGNDPGGPYDAKTGEYLGPSLPGWFKRISPPGRV